MFRVSTEADAWTCERPSYLACPAGKTQGQVLFEDLERVSVPIAVADAERSPAGDALWSGRSIITIWFSAAASAFLKAKGSGFPFTQLPTGGSER